MNKKTIIVITNTDSLLGYSLAHHFLKKSKANIELRLLCRHKEGLEHLQEMGGNVIEIEDYGDRDSIIGVLKAVNYAIYLPENSFEEGKLFFECTKETKVQHITMISFVGLHKDMPDSYGHLRMLYHLEQQLMKIFSHRASILQSSLWHQMFYYFAPMIEDHNKITLLLHHDTKWGTVDLSDLTDAIYLHFSEEKQNRNPVLRFTAKRHMKTQEMVEAASHGLDRKEIKYERVKYDDLYSYLKRIHNDNRFRRRPHHNPTFPLGSFLKKDVIETMLEYMQLMDETNIHETQDLENTLNREPISIKCFFEKNRDQFQKLR